MGSSFAATCEIVENKEGLSSFKFSGRSVLPNFGLSTGDKDLERPVLKLCYKGSLEDDMNQLFESINFNKSGMSPPQQVGTSASRSTNRPGKNNASKKPVYNVGGAPRSQAVGTSELKQALRDQEIAAGNQKQLSLPKASDTAAEKRVSKGGRIRKLYGSVLVESKNGPGINGDENKVLMVEILGEDENNLSENVSEQPHILQLRSSGQISQTAKNEGTGIMMIPKGDGSVSGNLTSQEVRLLRNTNNVYVNSESHESIPSLAKSVNGTIYMRKVRLLHMVPASSTVTGIRVGKLTRNVPRVPKPMLRNKVSVKKKMKHGLYPVDEVDGFYDPNTKHLLCHRCHSALKSASKEEEDHNPQSRLDFLNLAVEKVITEDGWDNLNPGVRRDTTDKPNRNVSSNDITGESNQDSSCFDIIAEEPNQDFGGSEDLRLGLKKDITEETNEDFIGLGSLNPGVKNFGGEDAKDTSSSSHVVSGVSNRSAETSQDSLASLFVDNSPEVGLASVNSDLKDTGKEVKYSLSQADHSDEICSESESSATTILDNINQGTIKEATENLSNSSINNLSQGSQDIIEKCSSSTRFRSSFGNRPHMSKDLRWEAIQHVRSQQGVLGLKHFNLLKKLGCGDIGTVYLAELISTNCLFAIKVMDNEYLERRNKMARAQTERHILKMLDHPFLPTLYSHFTSDDLSCLVMEYCPGGDLHVLRQKQPGRCFPEPATRFYVAEVLLALEYLHMLGVIYRDLKPENILVREDGHIMVTDFDLSLRWTVSPTLYSDPIRLSSHIAHSSCIDPFRIPSFIPRLLPATSRSKKKKSKPKRPELLPRLRSLPQLVAEPTDARSNSFVGTHEYLAPEIIKGDGHGASVDWWTFGVLLYELLYGKTPFKGSTDEETLANVVLQNLKFPDSPAVSYQAKDLIRGLLVKEPENRVGSAKGAADIKRHPFFEGLNWALIRCAIPPELPDVYDYEVGSVVSHDGKNSFLECKADGEHLQFDLF